MTGEPKPAGAPRPSIVVALQRTSVVWLSSVRPDGGPHVVPLWFLWDGESILVFSKPGAQKVRNVRAEPRVMVAVGQPGLAFDVELIDAVAELAREPSSRLLSDEFARKYADLADRAGITFDRFAAVYEQPIWIRPTRWLEWGGAGWTALNAAV
jgi:PPOX class probable F420-dependent enzyme